MVAKKKAAGKSSRHSRQTAKPPDKQDICFIMMPFGEWFDYYYETIYFPAIEAADLIPKRADDLYRPSAIVHDIWALTQQARVILADLSEKNPNVFYELGLAHAIAKPVILVTESIDDVPFDLRSLRVLAYNKNEPDWGERLKEKIEGSIREVLNSPLESVLPTFLKIKESSSTTTVTKAEKDLIALRQDMDLLKREIQARIEYSPRVSKPRLGKFEASELAYQYICKKTPERIIFRRLQEGGIDTTLARDIVNLARERFERETQQGAATPPEAKDKETQ
jgi:hypothetical protein